MTHDYATVESLAIAICALERGKWDAVKHKRNHWRKRAIGVMDKAENAEFVAWWTKTLREQMK